MKPHQERVVAEKLELDEKIVKLDAFISSSTFYQSLGMPEQNRLARQLGYMKAYSAVLAERIENFE